MKKIFYPLAIGTIVLSAMSSCNSDLNLDKELKFSSLSVEAQKAKIEENGIEFIDAIEDLTESTAFEALNNFGAIGGSDVSYAPLKQITVILQRNDTKVLTDVNEQLRVVAIDSEMWGEWEWNADRAEFDLKKSLTNKAIYKFPKDSSSTSNNATVTITYEDSDVKIPDSDEKYPAEITFVLEINDKEVMSADFEGTYYDNGSPKSLSSSLDIDDYSWTAKLKNDQEEASETYEFKKGLKTLLKSEAIVTGSLTGKNLVEGDIVESVNSFAIYFQVMDVAVKGGTDDFNAFRNAVKDLDAEYTITTESDYSNYSYVDTDSEEYNQELAKITNKYFVVCGYFKDGVDKKFADVEYYVVASGYYTEYVLNESTQEYESVEVPAGYTLEPRFVLSDGSKVSIEEYAQEGFDDLVERMEDLEINQSYSIQ